MTIFNTLIGSTWAELALPIVPVTAVLSPQFTGKLDLGKAPGMPWASGGWGPIKWKAWGARDGTAVMRLTRWSRWLPTPNLGLRTGTLVGLDIDCEDDQLVGAIHARLLDVLPGDPMVRYRDNSPRRLLLYRTDQPMAKQTLGWDGGKLEVLGDGQQFVAWGTHPSGAALRWRADRFPVEPVQNLPLVRAGELQEALDALRALLGLQGKTLVLARPRGTDGHAVTIGDPDAQADEALVRSAVEHLPCDESTAPTREAWVRVVGAIYAASIGLGWGRDAAQAWAAKWTATPAWPVDDKTWHSFEGGTGWGARELFAYAERFGWQGGEPLARWRAERMADVFSAEPAPDLFKATNVTAMEASENSLWSDQALARRLAEQLHGRLMYCTTIPHGGWLIYDEGRWQIAYAAAGRIVGDVLIKMASKLVGDDYKALRKTLQSRRTHDAMMLLLKSTTERTGTLAVFDADPWLLNTPGGIVDLRTGKLMPHDPMMLMMRQTTVTPAFGVEPKVWLAFLESCMSADMLAWMDKPWGATLAGIHRDAALMFLYGPGRNGKTTMLLLWAAILGSYFVGLPMETLLATNRQHPEAIARLAGARYVTANEVPKGARWSTSTLKQLTGGDKLTARHLYGGSFEFSPMHTLWIAGNHRPPIDHIDAALAARINLIELNRVFLPKGSELPIATAATIAVADPELLNKLIAEGPAILAWAIEGCMRWQREGLEPKPRSLLSSTQEYFNENHPMMQWRQERTVAGPGELMSVLRADYAGWLAERGEATVVVNDTNFGRTFRELFGRDAVYKTERGMTARGVRLIPEDLFDETIQNPADAGS